MLTRAHAIAHIKEMERKRKELEKAEQESIQKHRDYILQTPSLHFFLKNRPLARCNQKHKTQERSRAALESLR